MENINITNLFITGRSRAGKTFLIERIINELNIEVSGFRTREYFIEGERKGFYLHGEVDLNKYENNMSISIQVEELSCMPILKTFNTLGVRIIEKSLLEYKNIILMDELGRLESKALEFIKAVNSALDSTRLVVGVLKKADTEFLYSIKNREDILVYDMDIESKEYIYDQMKNEIMKRVG